MNPSHEKFVEISNRLISALERLTDGITEANSWMRVPCETALANIRDLRDLASNGRLPISGGAGLGISRGLGEWAPDHIAQIGNELEKHFIENC